LGRLINNADGTLVLGLRQLIVNSGVWRPDTPEEIELSAAWTSPWMQIEAGMAIVSGIPVLVAPEAGVCEGVFARENWIGNVFGTSADEVDSAEVDAWASAVTAGVAATDGAHETAVGSGRNAT